MKKSAFILTACCLLLNGCGNQASSSSDTSQETTQDPEADDYFASLANDGFDIDLTQLNANMMYGQIFDMTQNPDRYIGKTVRAEGNFTYYQDPAGKDYFSVFIPDAAACCSQGIEFILTGEHKYPDDFPEPGSLITVTGTFSSYEEYFVNYPQLIDAEIVPNKEHDE